MKLNDHLRTVSDLLDDFTSAANRVESLLRVNDGGSGEDISAAVRQFMKEHDRTLEKLRETLDDVESNWNALAKETNSNELMVRRDLIKQLSGAQAARVSASLDALDYAIFHWPSEEQPGDKQQLASAVCDLKGVVSRWRSEWMPGVLSRLLRLPDIEESAYQKQRRGTTQR